VAIPVKVWSLAQVYLAISPNFKPVTFAVASVTLGTEPQFTGKQSWKPLKVLSALQSTVKSAPPLAVPSRV
jgi:hypothetical protein